MSFPIKFAERTGTSDFVSPAINLIGNVGAVVYGGLQLATISCLALKALGFNIAHTITASVVATIGISGCFAIHFGSLISLVLIAIAMAKQHREREATV
jgi:hypothetical protein